jgi:hypothetical protein
MLRMINPRLLQGLLFTGLLMLSVTSTVAARDADAAFHREFGDAFFARYWELNPDTAIVAGYYKVADRLLVADEKARASKVRQLDQWLARLRRFDPESLSPAVRADRALLQNAFEFQRWELTEYRAWAWNPSLYTVAEAFELVLAANYAPLEERLRAISKRLEAVPAYYAAAKASISNPTREHTQLAIEQSRGSLGVFGETLEKPLASSKLASAEREQFTRRLSAARAAVEDYVRWLEALDRRLVSGEVAARSFRIGPDLYETKFAYQIQSGDTAKALYERALQEKETLLSRMGMLSGMLWPKYFPNEPAPADRLDRIGRLIGKLSERHVAPEHFFRDVEQLIPQLSEWVTDHGLLGLDASSPLQVRETPPYKRGIARASIDAPGPYDPAAPTWFNVTPLDDLTPERAESFLREYNHWMLPILVIHEAIPGHYVQLVYANKSPSRIKAIFGNDAMVEGWAVYTERMMLESGFGGSSAESWLIYSKWNLRSVCNAILDYAVHVLGMSEADARALLIREAFQSEEEASGKWRRVTLSSVQLTSYYAGYAAIYDLRERLKRETGSRFDLRRFHEQFLSYGNAPVGLIAELML